MTDLTMTDPALARLEKTIPFINVDEPDTLVFDPEGDLIFLVHNGEPGHKKLACLPAGTIRLRVSSLTMARYSIVFDRMLYGRFTESKPLDPSKNWAIPLPEDEAPAIALLCYLMHGHYNNFVLHPPQWGGAEQSIVKDIYDFVVVLDKYDCIRIAEPYAWRWFRALEEVKNRSRKTLYCLAWIYFQLGHKLFYQQVMGQLIYEREPYPVEEHPPVLPPTLHGKQKAESRLKTEDLINIFPSHDHSGNHES